MLEPKEEELLEHTYEIEKENNSMLHKMYSNMWWSRVFSALYWIVLLALMFGAYYYIQPYIGPMMQSYESASKLLNGIGNVGK